MSELTSRERVERALNHEELDRVPIDLGSSRVTGIAAIAYRNLLEHLGIGEEVRLFDIKQQLAMPSVEVVDRLGGDVMLLSRLAPTTGMPFMGIDRWKAGRMTDGAPCLVPEDYQVEVHDNGIADVIHEGCLVAQRTPGSLYFDVCSHPLAEAESCADIDAYEFPDPWSEREAEFLRGEVERLYHGTDKALFAGVPLMNGSFMEIGAVLFGYETFMMNLYTEREMMEHWLDRMLEHDMEVLGPYLEIAGPYICGIQMNDDFGAQDALQISPQIYREMFKPRQEKWIEFVKARTDAKVFIHCDGAVEELLPDFIEIGIDILNPLQTNARGMAPDKIKRKYGRDLSFWGGGSETQTTLPFGTLDEIRAEVAERVRLLGRGGGYVFGTIHNIQADISPEKIMAVFDTARETRVGGRKPMSGN